MSDFFGQLQKIGSTATPEADLARRLLAMLKAPNAAPSESALEQTLEAYRELRDALDARVEVWDNRFSAMRARGDFHFVAISHEKSGLPMQQAVHVDVGCGGVNPYARMFTHLMAGAARAICFELDSIQDHARAVRALPRLVSAAVIDPSCIYGDHAITGREIMANIADFDLAKMAKGDPAGINSDRLSIVRRSATDTGLPDASVDMIFTNSVLEHLPDLDAAMAEFARITKPGGYSMHGVDTRDHRWYGDPSLDSLEFLTNPSHAAIVHVCNRVRMFQHEECFVRNGFSIVDRHGTRSVPVTDKLRRRLVEPWRSMSDEQLGTIWTLYLIRRD